MIATNHASPDRIERVLAASRRGLMIVLAMVLIAAATLLAHALRPESLLANWPARAPWMVPVAIVVLAAAMGTSQRKMRDSGELQTVLEDEFRQANLARAQRLALVTVIAAQVPLSLLALSDLGTAAAVSVMAVTTVTAGMVTLIVSFLYFDRG